MNDSNNIAEVIVAQRITEARDHIELAMAHLRAAKHAVEAADKPRTVQLLKYFLGDIGNMLQDL